MTTRVFTNTESTHQIDELSCYLESDIEKVDLSTWSTIKTQHTNHHYIYALPMGEVWLLKTTIYLLANSSAKDIEKIRKTAVKAALLWQKRCLKQGGDKAAKRAYVYALDIQIIDILASNNDNKTDELSISVKSMNHHFGASYFMEEIIVDISETQPLLQLFGQPDWQSIVQTVMTPAELWRFLELHDTKVRQSSLSGTVSFENERELLTQFLDSATLFKKAISIDSALLESGMQNTPNASLKAMLDAQSSESLDDALKPYQQNLINSSKLWTQINAMMIRNHEEFTVPENSDNPVLQSNSWQKQLLDESLFSRHELVRTLYNYPNQSDETKKNGYTIHQHSYESLGRHYVLVFYGQDADGEHGKAQIEHRLEDIATDVAARLPLEDLHHIVVMGIDFFVENEETYLDINIFMQSVTPMSPKERQLTKQLQMLKLSNQEQKVSTEKRSANLQSNYKLPNLKINMNLPSYKNGD